jgi:carbon storage regulator
MLSSRADWPAMPHTRWFEFADLGDQGGSSTMLVLTRKSNQSIMIGDDIEVSVLAIMGEKVRIGIQAPRDIPVFRKEVYLEIQQEQVGSGKDGREEVDAALQGLGDKS